ncbi:MAG: YtxH domain-containing protein [Gemmatimonadota bacterium]
MSERGESPYIIVEKGGSGFGSFVLGALLGAGVALLLAPRSGEETQAELKAQARKWKGIAEERVRDASRALGQRVDDAREELHSRVDDVRGAIDSGRQAARDARGDLERRLEQTKAAYRAGIDAARTAAREVPGDADSES